MSSILLGFSPTDRIDTALITRRLKAAEPTMVEGPSSPGVSSSKVTVSMTESKISGALEPRAMRVKFAMVGFQTGISMVNSSPIIINKGNCILPSFLTTIVDVWDVMVSIALRM